MSGEVRPAVEGAFVAEEWGPFGFGDDVDCIAGVKSRQEGDVGWSVLSAAEAEAAYDWNGGALVVNAMEGDFVAGAPREARRFVAKDSVPAQRRFEAELVVIEELCDVIWRKRLLSDRGTCDAEREPTEKRRGCACAELFRTQ